MTPFPAADTRGWPPLVSDERQGKVLELKKECAYGKEKQGLLSAKVARLEEQLLVGQASGGAPAARGVGGGMV